MRVDVAIVGAGPGGGMAAYWLAPTGLDVVILEKEMLPRHKACGGGLPASVKSILDWDLAPLIENEVSVRKYLNNFAQPKVVTGSSFLLIDRSRFDAHLVERAVSSSKGTVKLRDGFRVSHVEETEEGVWVQGEKGERIEAGFLIGADGAFTRVGRCLGLNKGASPGLAIEAEVEVSPAAFEAERRAVTINYFCLDHGYGWIFPKRDGTLSCGVCAWRGRPNLRAELEGFLAKSFPPGSIRRVQRFGHPIPLYAGHHRIATRRACLVGDAASLVDPIMGGGICFALDSGALAAKVIMSLAAPRSELETGHTSPSRGCQVYESLIHEGIGAALEKQRRFVQPIFMNAPQFFYQRFILEGLSYSHLAHELTQRLGKTAVQDT